MNKESLVKSRRFKYGISAIVFTCVFVAAIIAINVIFTALAGSYMWYADMTKEQLYELSDAAKALVTGIERTNIKIIFCAPADQLDENYYQKLVHTVALNFAKEFDFIDVEYIDIITNPSSARPYMTTEASKIKTTNVIITSGSDFRLFAIEAFYTFAESDNSVFAFNAEKKIIAAILQMQGDRPICYFTTGHGENIDNSELWSLFEEAGYDTRKIDLDFEDIDDSAKIVIINGPKYDFGGMNSDVNQIKKIDYFIDNFGSLMLFIDPSAQDMPELEELLSEWGIGFGNALIKDYSNSVSVDGTALVSVYPVEGSGSSLHTNLRAMENAPKTIMRNCRPIEILWENYDSRNVSPVLSSTENAVAVNTKTGEEQEGPFNLMALSVEMRYIDNEPIYTYVIVSGTSQFADTSYLQTNTYGNKDIMYSLMKALGKENVPIDIDFKVFEDLALDITTAEATRTTILYTVGLPIIVAAIGIVVWARRRHL